VHVNAFDFLGGVPRAAVLDNLKVGITKPSRYEPGVKWRERSRRHQPYPTIELLVANDGRTACPVKAVSHRRWGPKASLDRACRLAILGHRVRRLADA
jgi:hypothetical protein